MVDTGRLTLVLLVAFGSVNYPPAGDRTFMTPTVATSVLNVLSEWNTHQESPRFPKPVVFASRLSEGFLKRALL
jgi:hypothetical protein